MTLSPPLPPTRVGQVLFLCQNDFFRSVTLVALKISKFVLCKYETPMTPPHLFFLGNPKVKNRKQGEEDAPDMRDDLLPGRRRLIE